MRCRHCQEKITSVSRIFDYTVYKYYTSIRNCATLDYAMILVDCRAFVKVEQGKKPSNIMNGLRCSQGFVVMEDQPLSTLLKLNAPPIEVRIGKFALWTPSRIFCDAFIVAADRAIPEKDFYVGDFRSNTKRSKDFLKKDEFISTGTFSAVFHAVSSDGVWSCPIIILLFLRLLVSLVIL